MDGQRPGHLAGERVRRLPLVGLLSLDIMACTAAVFQPLGVQVDSLAQVALPVGLAIGVLGLVIVLFGRFAATFGAALETGLSAGTP
jgi:hypothetical protein